MHRTRPTQSKVWHDSTSLGFVLSHLVVGVARVLARVLCSLTGRQNFDSTRNGGHKRLVHPYCTAVLCCLVLDSTYQKSWIAVAIADRFLFVFDVLKRCRNVRGYKYVLPVNVEIMSKKCRYYDDKMSRECRDFDYKVSTRLIMSIDKISTSLKSRHHNIVRKRHVPPLLAAQPRGIGLSYSLHGDYIMSCKGQCGLYC